MLALCDRINPGVKKNCAGCTKDGTIPYDGPFR